MSEDRPEATTAPTDEATTNRSIALAVVGLRNLLGILFVQLQAVEHLLIQQGVITADALRSEREAIRVDDGRDILAHIDRELGPLFRDAGEETPRDRT